jgi:hypothetical protein
MGGMRWGIFSIVLCLAVLALTTESASAHRLFECESPLRGNAQTRVVEVRVRCNYPLQDFRIVLSDPYGSWSHSILGGLQTGVTLHPTPGWSRYVGPIYFPPQGEGPEAMTCERKPPFPRGLHKGFIECTGQVEPGTWIEFAFKATRPPCDNEGEVGFNDRSDSGFTICEHHKCFPWGFGESRGQRVRC